jgi:NAD(P)-dependent dehydrogenase (short-subunit alcohol dehydrogenase family)
MQVLDGKAVVITGAGRGLGRAYALHAAKAGAAVVVNDVDGELARHVAGRIQESGGRAVASTHSVADPEQASAAIERCVTVFGAIDGLVNNAALNYQALPWQDDPGRARALVDVNVLGPLYCGIAAAKVMCALGSGAIVNVTSGSMLGQRSAAAYSASKGAIASMTVSWAMDLADHGIRVNGICPLAWTRMQSDPLARLRCSPADSPDRIAPLVTYLLSDLAVGINGQLIRFVGDKLCLVRQPAVKEPILLRDQWEVEDIAEAFDGELTDVLESPPASRIFRT